MTEAVLARNAARAFRTVSLGVLGSGWDSPALNCPLPGMLPCPSWHFDGTCLAGRRDTEGWDADQSTAFFWDWFRQGLVQVLLKKAVD
jgi:hypothetical protein